MDKKKLEERLKQLEVMVENHQQDVNELGMVISGLKKQIKESKPDASICRS